MKQLLDAGMHFGHQTRRWNPKMRRYIWGERAGIYIVDLVQTMQLIEEAYNFLGAVAQRGGTVLFVGTKKQAQDAIEDNAKRAGMYYVNHRWLGGLLTNWRTISDRLKRLEELRNQHEHGQLNLLGKKERQVRLHELEKLEQSLGGMSGMERLPDAIVIIDLNAEQLAVKEARRCRIPVVGLVDTNSDPDQADYVVPGNDDAIRSCNLFLEVMGNAITDAKTLISAEEFEATADDAGEPEGEPVGAGVGATDSTQGA